MNLSLLTYNIRFGGAGREAQLAAIIRSLSPDLVVFQEATIPRVIEEIAKATDMPFWAAKSKHSIGYCSRIEISHHEWHYPRKSRHAFLEIVPAGSEARIFGLHLRAMFSKWGELHRNREIQDLLTSIKKHQEGFHALVGDFNSLAPGELLDTKKMPHWIRAMVWLSGRDIQRKTVQIMQANGYVDCFRKLHPDEKGYTFPTYDPHVRLDYVFVPESHTSRVTECQVIDHPPAISASDHFPLLARLDIP